MLLYFFIEAIIIEDKPTSETPIELCEMQIHQPTSGVLESEDSANSESDDSDLEEKSSDSEYDQETEDGISTETEPEDNCGNLNRLCVFIGSEVVRPSTWLYPCDE